MRHRMPDSGDRKVNRGTPQSPTKPQSSTKPRFAVDLPKTPAPSTSSPPSSPRRASATSSSQPAHTPRSQPAVPGTPRAAPVDVSDRNIAAALATADKIATRKGPSARLTEFRSALSQASAIPPTLRGKVVLALAKSLSSIPDDAKGPCLAELRELTVDMPPELRKALLQQLLEQLTSNRDSSSEDSSDKNTVVDAELFAKGHDTRESRCAAIRKLMAEEITDDSLSKLAARIRSTGAAHTARGVIAAVINGLSTLEPNDQNRVIALFADAGISCEDVLGALLDTPHGKKIEKHAKSTGYSLSALYLGALTGNRVAMQRLLLILGDTSLPVALHVYLAEEIGELRRNPRPAPTLTAASRDLLLEIVSLSAMSEHQRCLLIHALSALPDNKLYAALQGGELDEENDYWAYAHQVLADVIDIGSCFEIGSGDGLDADLASYALRAGNLVKDDSVKAILEKGKCTWDAPRLRALMLGKVDVRKVREAVFNVLGSNLPFEDKLALLKAEAEPLGESIADHVREAMYQEAVKQYKKKHTVKNIANDLAYAVVKDDEKKHDDAYKTLTRELDPDAKGEIKSAGKLAMVAAQRSRLPAMHVAAMMPNSDLVRGYMETVAGFAGTLEDKEIAAFLELSHNGMSLLYTAMMEGTAEVVAACLSVILESELSLKTVISLLEARRQPDRLGAFYMAMSIGVRETALQFARDVLGNKTIANDAKFQLLQCAKPESAKKTGSDQRVIKALQEAATTARAEAERTGHERLVKDFDVNVEQSRLSPTQKQKLQTT